MNVKIFYSWQSNLPRDINQDAIRICIKKAITSIEEENKEGVQIDLDEATRGESGSPDIPSTIFDKIRNCDIFLCDITFVDSRSNEKKVRFSNPNVLIELGYAISVLGWQRIILVFNKSYGDFQNNLPFDIDKRRINAFTINDKNDKSGKGQLKTDLIKQLELIIENKPPKNNIAFGNIEDVHKKRDYRTLDELLEFVHIESIENFVQNMPMLFLKDIDYYYKGFSSLYRSKRTHFYDEVLGSLMSEFKERWGHFVSYEINFEQTNQTKKQDGELYLSLKEYTYRIDYRENIMSRIFDTKGSLIDAFTALLDYIRKEYPHIDITAKSDKAYAKYLEFIESKGRIE